MAIKQTRYTIRWNAASSLKRAADTKNEITYASKLTTENIRAPGMENIIPSPPYDFFAWNPRPVSAQCLAAPCMME